MRMPLFTNKSTGYGYSTYWYVRGVETRRTKPLRWDPRQMAFDPLYRYFQSVDSALMDHENGYFGQGATRKRQRSVLQTDLLSPAAAKGYVLCTSDGQGSSTSQSGSDRVYIRYQHILGAIIL